MYLNRIYCEGSEVPLGIKVAARADRELWRRFAGIFTQVDTVFGAVEKGDCSNAMYQAAMARFLELLFMTCRRVRSSASHVIFSPWLRWVGLSPCTGLANPRVPDYSHQHPSFCNCKATWGAHLHYLLQYPTPGPRRGGSSVFPLFSQGSQDCGCFKSRKGWYGKY